MDPLTDLLSVLRPKAHIYSRFEGHAPWAVNFNCYDYVKFGMVMKGNCLMTLKGLSKPIQFKTGDAWLLFAPKDYRMGSDLTTKPVHSDEVFINPNAKTFTVGKKSPKKEQTLIFGGRIDLDHTNTSVLLDSLPRLIHMKSEDVSPVLKGIFLLLQAEASTNKAASSLMLEKLIQMVFIESLRTINPNELKIGCLKGMAHPQTNKVLQAIHSDYKKDWSVEGLAKIYGASRSSFAAHFKSMIGVSPMEYLQSWRMITAKERLRDSTKLISEIAYSVGYDSETAFSTAFSRVVGVSPKKFRDQVSMT